MEYCVKAKNEEVKQGFLQGAFIGWQIQEIVKGALQENPQTQRFFEYAEALGLIESDKPKATGKDAIDEAISIAEQIRRADAERNITDGDNNL